MGLAGQPGVVRGEGEPAGSSFLVGAQLGGAGHGGGGRRVAGPFAGPAGGCLQLGCGLGVGACRRSCQVPGSPVGRGVADRVGQRAMDLLPAGGRRGPVDRRAQQRVAQLDPAVHHVQEAGLLSGGRVGQTQRCCRAQDGVELAAVVGCGYLEQTSRRRWELTYPAQEGAFQLGAER